MLTKMARININNTKYPLLRHLIVASSSSIGSQSCILISFPVVKPGCNFFLYMDISDLQ